MGDVEIGPGVLPAVKSVHSPLPCSQVRQEIERILRSSEFGASAQLCRFLRHIVEHSLNGEGGSLKESAIGVAVFNRGAEYDPKVDPIVRVEARRLRARLESYYQHEGAGSPIRISLPKGGYCPRFETVQPAFAPDALPAASPVPTERPRWHRFILPFGLAAVLLAAGFAFYTVGRPGAVSVFWSSILDGDRPALVIAADSALVLLQDIAKRQVQLSDYMTGDYRSRLFAEAPITPAIPFDFALRRYTSVADLEFLARLLRRPEAARQGVFIRYARDVRVEDLKARNAILLGARQSNPWVELFEPSATFALRHDDAAGSFTILNRRPGPQDAGETLIRREDLENEFYSVINYHRNPQSGMLALMLAGTSVAGTEAAADFLLDDRKLLPWLQKASGNGGIREFDLLLHGRNLSGTAPRADVVSFHVRR